MNGYKIVLLKAIFMLYKLPECERVCSGICILIVRFAAALEKWNTSLVEWSADNFLEKISFAAKKKDFV